MTTNTEALAALADFVPLPISDALQDFGTAIKAHMQAIEDRLIAELGIDGYRAYCAERDALEQQKALEREADERQRAQAAAAREARWQADIASLERAATTSRIGAVSVPTTFALQMIERLRAQEQRITSLEAAFDEW